MADEEDRSSAQNTVSANRAQSQGLGLGQRELNEQRVANPELSATDPDRPEPFDESLDRTTNADRPAEADFAGQEPGDTPRAEPRDFRSYDEPDEKDYDTADLGVGTPPNVDVHDLGQRDKPEEAWGDEAVEGAMHSANHTRRPIRTEAERGQGAKTRKANKDIVSRRL
jgi:hypothetical protein